MELKVMIVSSDWNRVIDENLARWRFLGGGRYECDGIGVTVKARRRAYGKFLRLTGPDIIKYLDITGAYDVSPGGKVGSGRRP